MAIPNPRQTLRFKIDRSWKSAGAGAIDAHHIPTFWEVWCFWWRFYHRTHKISWPVIHRRRALFVVSHGHNLGLVLIKHNIYESHTCVAILIHKDMLPSSLWQPGPFHLVALRFARFCINACTKLTEHLDFVYNNIYWNVNLASLVLRNLARAAQLSQ